jgi:3-dehydroquinate synthase/2-deoxy-scyllo-inosose synthase
MERISIALSGVSYAFWLGTHCTDEIVDRLCSLAADRYFLIADQQISDPQANDLHARLARRVPAHLIFHPTGECAKRLTEVERIIDRTLELGATRASCIVTFGGGVTGNLGGLVAALLFRGIRLVHVPTTLIGMHDSVISLKQAVNAKAGKNLIGTYFAPQFVLADTAYLRTLCREHVRSGLCEVIKNALAICPEQIPWLERTLRPDCDLDPGIWAELVRKSIAAKLSVMNSDPYEKTSGLALEYGHTVGHAIEHACGGALSHGEAVGLGMLVAARVSQLMGYLPPTAVAKHWDLLRRSGMHIGRPASTSVDAILKLVCSDNKRGHLTHQPNEIPMVILAELGCPVLSSGLPLTRVPLPVLAEALEVLEPAATPVRRAISHSSAQETELPGSTLPG